jgi:ubiquinol-cytochrome c reductase cytochrome c1 subunit
MRTDMHRAGLTLVPIFALTIALGVVSALLPAGAIAADESASAAQPAPTENAAEKVAPGPETEKAEPVDWKKWTAQTDISNTASMQRGARNFVAYCLGCHSMKYERWTRVAKDLQIPEKELEQYLVPVGDKPSDYIFSTMPAEDAENWFGKAPPDLSLMARLRGSNYLYQFLKTFYVDPSRQTGTNNLALPSVAMPDILSSLEGLKKPVFRTVKTSEGQEEQEFDHFEQIAPGRLSPEEYDGFVRDTVNFLTYVGEPAQVQRHAVGLWVVLFLLVFTWFAWLMKQEYWKDVH